MKYTISDVHRKKIAQATHSAGKIATVAQIALGTGGVDGSGNVKITSWIRNEADRRGHPKSIHSIREGGRRLL